MKTKKKKEEKKHPKIQRHSNGYEDVKISNQVNGTGIIYFPTKYTYMLHFIFTTRNDAQFKKKKNSVKL